ASSAGTGGAPTEPAPRIFYTDITHAPVSGGPDGGGALVTIYGLDLGSTQGRVSFAGSDLTVKSWGGAAYRGMSKVVAQIPAGTPAVVGTLEVVSSGNQVSNQLPLVTTQRKILYVGPSGTGDGSLATPTSLSGLKALYSPGDLVYLRAGSYNQNMEACANGENCAWSVELTSTATSNNPVQIVGFPGEEVTFQNPADVVVVKQNFVRLANLKLHAGGGSGLIIVASKQVALIGSELWSDQLYREAIASANGETSYEVTGNYVHHFGMGTSNASEVSSRTVRFNQFEDIVYVLVVSEARDEQIEDYGNSAAAVVNYVRLEGCDACDTSPTVTVFDNVISSARYFAYQFNRSPTQSSVRLLHNTVLDAECGVGSSDLAIALDGTLQGNIITASHATCAGEDAMQAEVGFDGQKNHWGSATAPDADPTGVTGVLNLDADSRPSSSSSVCGGIARGAAPLDVDALGVSRKDPTAFGAYECP
ncbi:MAG: IPT/TIG domain-containing protein, partial [Polyangiaceae bacterium]